MNDNGASAKFGRVLDSYQSDGIAEWKTNLFINSLDDFAKKSQVSPSIVQKSIKRIFLDVFNQEKFDVKTFVLKKVYNRISSLVETANSNGNNGVFNGCPLELEDRLGEMSFSEAVGASSILDDSALVSEKEYRAIITRLCLAFSSIDGNIRTQQLQKLLPMVVFCKWRKKCADPTGICYITPIWGENKTIISLLEQRINLSGSYPSNIWRSDSTSNSSPSNVSSPKSNSHKFHSLCIDNLIQQHLGRCQSDSFSPVFVKSYAEFELLESNKQLLESPDDDLALTYVNISIMCSKVEKILHIDKQHVSEIKLHITPAPGDMRSSAFSLYKAVQVLEGFFCAFGEDAEVKWTSIDEQVSSQTEVFYISAFKRHFWTRMAESCFPSSA